MKTRRVVMTVICLACMAWIIWCGLDPDLEQSAPKVSRPESPIAVSAPLPEALPAEAAAIQPLREPVVVGDGAPSTGDLLVNVRHAKDRAPAAGVIVIAVRNGSDARVGGWRQPADAAGLVRFTGLPTGRMHVSCDREREGKRVDVIAGTVVALDYELPAGLEISGIVVDAAATPIPNAIVEVAPLATLGTLAEAIARTGADGRFTVRTGLDAALVGARADGHAPSNLRFIWDRDGSQAELRLVLGEPAGSVEGLVVDCEGKPVVNAIVQVGAGSSTGVSMKSPPFPAMARSDAEGRFRAVGVRSGEHPVVGCAAGLGPWFGTCHVVANQVSRIRIVLQAGGTVCGAVVDSQGVAVVKAEVRVGDPKTIVYFREFTAADGTFTMTGLPPGEVLVEAKHDEAGKTEQRVIIAPGVAVPCMMQLAHGLQMRGRVVDASGVPIEMALVRCFASGDGPQWSAEVRAGAGGSFTLNNCPEGRAFRLVVQAAGFETLTRTDIVLGQPLDLVLQPSSEAAASVRMVGIVLAPDGVAVAGATVMANGNDPPSSARMVRTDASGRFEFAPMPPGRWSVSVRTKDYPTHASESFDLRPDALHDFGVIQLVVGGHARVNVEGDRLDADFVIYNGSSRAIRVMTDADGTVMSPMLAPGPHLLRVSGKAAAAQSIPFTVVAGEIATVAVRIARGVSQAFVLDGRGLVPRPEQVVLDVLRGSEVLVQLPVAMPSDRPATVDLCLPEGDLTVTVGAARRELGRVTFRIGATEGPPLRIVMQ